jgi:hypothetical protein
MRWLMRYLFSRLREPSTWRGLVALAASLGVAISPELGEAVIAVGLALMGLIGALAPDALPQPRDPPEPAAGASLEPDRLRRDAGDGMPVESAPGAPGKPTDPWGWQRKD